MKDGAQATNVKILIHSRARLYRGNEEIDRQRELRSITVALTTQWMIEPVSTFWLCKTAIS